MYKTLLCFQITTDILAVLFFGGFTAGLVDFIAAGELIFLPVLLSIGLLSRLALGTNELQRFNVVQPVDWDVFVMPRRKRGHCQ